MTRTVDETEHYETDGRRKHVREKDAHTDGLNNSEADDGKLLSTNQSCCIIL